jgi:hypothetical protein
MGDSLQDRKGAVSTYSHIGATDLTEGSGLDSGKSGVPAASTRSRRNFERMDRLKAVLVIAAAFASVMVSVVGARSILLKTDRPGSNAQVAR